MGLGDELLAAGHAKAVYDELLAAGRSGRRIAICDEQWHPRWHDLWRGLDFIAHPADPDCAHAHRIRNASGCRPYIQYPFTVDTGWRWTGWRARDHRPVVHLFDEDIVGASKIQGDDGYLLIEPSCKEFTSPNKCWPFTQYQALALELSRTHRLVRAMHQDPRPLRGAHDWYGLSFRATLGVLSRATLYIGPEGALHHAAAALGIQAVVIFGGAIDPIATGYPDHTNLAAPRSCGSWRPCPHCQDWLQALTVQTVADAVETALSARPTPAVR